MFVSVLGQLRMVAQQDAEVVKTSDPVEWSRTRSEQLDGLSLEPDGIAMSAACCCEDGEDVEGSDLGAAQSFGATAFEHLRRTDPCRHRVGGRLARAQVHLGTQLGTRVTASSRLSGYGMLARATRIAAITVKDNIRVGRDPAICDGMG